MTTEKAIEWALECMQHYSECDITDEDRESIAEAKEVVASLIITIESLEINKEQDATQYANLRTLYYEMEREIEQKDALIESHKARVLEAEQWKNNAESAADAANHAKDYAEQLEQKNESQKKELDHNGKIWAEMGNEMLEMQELIESQKEEIEALRQALTAESLKNANLQKKLKSEELSLSQQIRAYSSLEKQVESQTETLFTNESRIEHLENESLTLLRKRNEYFNENTDLLAQIESLQKENERKNNALFDILNGNWSSNLDNQGLRIYHTNRINPISIASEALSVSIQKEEPSGNYHAKYGDGTQGYDVPFEEEEK